MSYDSCLHPSLRDLLTSLKAVGIQAVCRLYDTYSQTKPPLSMLLNTKDLWDYTHFLLFLSPYDIELVKVFLESASTGKNYQLYGPSVYRTLHQNTSQSSIEQKTVCSDVFINQMMSHDIENLFTDEEHHQKR